MSIVLALLLSACTPPNPSPPVGAPGTPDAAKATPPADPAEVPLGLTYEIYVRSFQDSDGDGVGDLAGVESRLDYVADLGVRTVWLMPAFPAYGPAGYDVTSYLTLEPAYGDREDLLSLVDAAHAHGMRVLLDLPFNHVHRDHPWFVDAEAGGLYQDWFVYREAAGDGVRWFDAAVGGSYYAYFGAEMPDLDWENPAVYDTMLGVLDDWLDAGADGYRLDAVLMLVEDGAIVEGSDASHALLADILGRLRTSHPEAFFLAEASEWDVTRSLSWLGSGTSPEADAVLDFPRRDALLDSGLDGGLRDLTDIVSAQVGAAAGVRMASFLGSHDVDRLATEVASVSARRALVVTHILLPGSPVLYYGDELDLANATTGTGQDYAMRAPMPWDAGHEAGFTTGSAWFPPDPAYADGVNAADEAGDPGSMYSLVRGLSCVRDARALDTVDGWTVLSSSSASVLAFVRRGAAGDVLVVVNLAATFAPDVTVAVSGTWYDLSNGARVRGSRRLPLGTFGGHGWRVLSTRSASCTLPVGSAG